MELLQLRYFCDAASSENFSKTAKKFLVPTSNISQSVKRLENELGCQLFEHRANKIILNDNGRLLLKKAGEALALLDEASVTLKQSGEIIYEDIRIACLCNRRTVTEAIESFKQKYPQTNIIIHHSFNSEEKFDIIISDICPCEYVEKRFLLSEDICVAMSNTHPLASSAHLSAAHLKNERFITMTEGSSLYKITQNVCLDHGFSPNIAIQTDDPLYLRKYVELGLGIAFFPKSSWQGLFSDTVVLKQISGLTRKTFAYFPSSLTISRTTEDFFDILKKKADA